MPGLCVAFVCCMRCCHCVYGVCVEIVCLRYFFMLKSFHYACVCACISGTMFFYVCVGVVFVFHFMFISAYVFCICIRLCLHWCTRLPKAISL